MAIQLGISSPENVFGYLSNRFASVVDEVFGHPRHERQQHESDNDQLRYERDRSVLHLRDRLQQTHQDAHDQRRHDRRCEQHSRRSLQRDAQDRPRTRYHRQTPAHTGWKLDSSMTTTRCHPSTSTNSISFRGNEIVDGGTMTQPIDIVTLETTRSTITKGRKT